MIETPFNRLAALSHVKKKERREARLRGGRRGQRSLPLEAQGARSARLALVQTLHLQQVRRSRPARCGLFLHRLALRRPLRCAALSRPFEFAAADPDTLLALVGSPEIDKASEQTNLDLARNLLAQDYDAQGDAAGGDHTPPPQPSTSQSKNGERPKRERSLEHAICVQLTRLSW